MNATLKFILFSLLPLFCLKTALAAVQVGIPYQQSPPQHNHHLADILHWQVAPLANLCDGYFASLPSCPIRAPDNPDLVKIAADHSSLYQFGQSTLKGNVTIAQGDKCMSMDEARLYRDKRSGQVSRITLLGNIHIHQPGKLLRCERAIVYPEDNKGELHNAAYRIDLPPRHHKHCQPHQCLIHTAWGSAAYAEGIKDKYYKFEDASFSTCSPVDPAWQIHAHKIILDEEEGIVQAYKSMLLFYNHPVIYLPYYSFSINHERKSGFLSPIVGYTTESGLDIGVPFYFNLAPNYDGTITAHYLSERGLFLESEFRYLTLHSQGTLMLTYLPNDRRYAEFLEQNNLESTKNDRSALHYEHFAYLGDGWNGSINLNAVSDDYYLQNFAQKIEEITENQLQRRGEVYYNDDHNYFLMRLQAYQTLQPINEAMVTDIYRQLPHMVYDYVNTHLFHDLVFDVYSGYDHFIWPNSNTEAAHPDANRVYVTPTLSWPITLSALHIKPQVALNFTAYDLDHALPMADRHYIQRTTPIVSVDSHVYFDRDITLFHTPYTQTISPRIYYLYVPFRDQSDIPVFDTGIFTFNYDSLFRFNRFSGIDRIGDSHQLSYGITTYLINTDDGMEKLRASVGQAVYFQTRNVSLCSTPGDPHCRDRTIPPDERVSPIAAQVEYDFDQYWVGDGMIAWDPDENNTINASVDLRYHPAPNKVLNFSYTYSQNNFDPFSQARTETSLDQVDVAGAWPLSRQWSTLADWSYNLQEKHPQDYFAGFEYNTCCWAFRVMGGRSFNRFAEGNDPIFNTRFYVQLLLKGLGAFSPYDPSSVIAEHLPGYQDIFH